MVDLAKLPGTGEATAEKYKAAGFDTVEDIAHSTADDLVNKLGLNLAKAEKLITIANHVLQEEQVIIQTSLDIKNYQEKVVQYISTGSRNLDNVIGGGVATDAITLFAGPFSTGKTQICMQLAVNCAIDLKRKVVFIETEPSTFKPNRLLEMADKGRNAPINLEEDIFGIRAQYVTSPQKLYEAYRTIEDELIIGKKLDVGLICIDSFSGVFRTEYLGRETFSERSKEMARHLGYLQTLSSRYNMAIVPTGQTYGNPEAYAQGKAQRRFGIDETIYGGSFFQHAMTMQISLTQIHGGKKTDVDEYEAYVYDSSDRPKAYVPFVLTPQGVRDK